MPWSWIIWKTLEFKILFWYYKKNWLWLKIWNGGKIFLLTAKLLEFLISYIIFEIILVIFLLTALDDRQETSLIEIMVCCVKQAATGESPVGRGPNRKV